MTGRADEVRRHRAGRQRGGRASDKRRAVPKAPVQPPSYPQEPHHAEYNGCVLDDPYDWLRQRERPAVRRLLRAENAHVQSFYDAHQPTLRRTLYKEMLQRCKEDDASLPTLDRHFWYYVRQVRHEEHALFCRRPYDAATGRNVDFAAEVSALWRRDPNAQLPLYEDEIVFLDLNLLKQQLRLRFIELGDMDVSADETTLAVTLDCSNGKEVFTLFVLPIEDVNYARWLTHHAGDATRRWATRREQEGESIYGSPTSDATHGSAAGSPHVRRTRLFPSPTAPTGSSSWSDSNNDEGGDDAERSVTETASCTTTPPTTQPRCEENGDRATSTQPPVSALASVLDTRPAQPLQTRPAPQHRMLHRVDMFRLAGEVLWVGPRAVLYLALDEKMRPYQLVYHDLSRPDDDPAGTIVCFEEEDEAFWVGGLDYTSDERYVLFGSASSEVSELYVCPTVKPHDSTSPILPGVPLLLPWDEAADASLPRDSVTLAPVCRFAARQSSPAVEYDLDHHDSLLAPATSSREADGAAWLITSNAMSCTNFALFVLPDAAVQEAMRAACATPRAAARCGHDNTDRVTCLSASSRWQLLLEYGDGAVKVDGVECKRDFVLCSVRRVGSATVLFCPVTHIQRWWRATSSTTRRAPMRVDDWLDLASLFAVDRPVAEDGAKAAQESSMWEERVWSLDACRAAPSQPFMPASPRDLADSAAGTDADTHDDVRRTPLPWSVEAYSCDAAFASRTWRVSLSHLLHPAVQYEIRYNDDAREATAEPALHIVKRREEVVAGPVPYDAAEYDGAVVWVPSSYSFDKQPRPDARRVPTVQAAEDVLLPVYMCWRRQSYRSGTNAMLLRVYGSYGDCSDPEFSAERLVLLDRGFVWAMAAVRGGGELGIVWRDAGRRGQRGTSVNDFVSVASYVQDRGLCAPGHLIAAGDSAGGFVVFRAMNAAPQLFHAVIGGVPFVDCLATLLDPDLPLTITEWEEFGNPASDAATFARVAALSPMQTLPSDRDTQARLPHILLLTAWDDTRVGYWESLKFIARLRALRPGGTTRWWLHYCDFGGGHGGPTGRYEQLHEIAREYAFAIIIAKVADEGAVDAVAVAAAEGGDAS